MVLTTACNLRCSYCFQHRGTPRAIRADVIAAALELLQRSTEERPNVTFYGGEPLLQQSLIRAVVEPTEGRPSRAPSPRFEVVTNGTLLDEPTVRFLSRHDVRVQVSFDGVAAAQDARQPGTFETLEGALTNLRREHPVFYRDRVAISLVVTSENLPHLAESIGYLLETGCTEIIAYPLMTHDAGWSPGTIDQLDRQLEAVHNASLRYLERTGRTPCVLFRRAEDESSTTIAGGSMCNIASGENLVVDVDGQVYPCTTVAQSYQRFPPGMLSQYAPLLCLGHVRSHRLPQRLAALPEIALAIPFLQHKGRKYSSYGRCADCEASDECLVCPVAIGHIPGNTDPNRVPDHLCAFNLVRSKYRRSFPAQRGPLDIFLGRASLPEMMHELRAAVTSRRETGPSRGGGLADVR